jgi:hypothetical protein
MNEQIGSERLKRLIDQMGNEHRSVLGELRGLEVMLETSPPAQGDLERRLDRIASELEREFIEEEAGDLFIWLPLSHPEVSDEVSLLREQHGGMIADFRQLAMATRGAEEIRLGTELSIRIRAAIAKVREHEAQELLLVNRMVQLERPA